MYATSFYKLRDLQIPVTIEPPYRTTAMTGHGPFNKHLFNIIYAYIVASPLLKKKKTAASYCSGAAWPSTEWKSQNE